MGMQRPGPFLSHQIFQRMAVGAPGVVPFVGLRDQLEEELSRTAFRMEVLERGREMRDARPVEDLDGTACASVLSDALLTVYCVLRDVPDGAFGGETPERSR